MSLALSLIAVRRHCQISNSRLSLRSIRLLDSTVAARPPEPTEASGNTGRGVSRRQRDVAVDRDRHFGLATIGLREVETRARDIRLGMSVSSLTAVLTSGLGAETAKRASTTSAAAQLEALGDVATEGRRKKWAESLAVVTATPISSKYCRIGSAFPWR